MRTDAARAACDSIDRVRLEDARLDEMDDSSCVGIRFYRPRLEADRFPLVLLAAAHLFRGELSVFDYRSPAAER